MTMPGAGKQTFQPNQVTILGLSKSGAAVARYASIRGAQCFLSEVMPATENNRSLRESLESQGVRIEMGGHSDAVFSFSDLVVLSPGIPPSNPTLKQLELSGKELISEVELAYRESQRRESPIPWLAVTGTNGKTTTTTLIAEILKHAKLNAPACGNIGTPIIDVLNQEDHPHNLPLDFIVAELSSFQLHFSPTLKAKVAVFTNFTPDHIDWHGSVDAYLQDKLRLFSNHQSPDWAVVWKDDPVLAKNIPSHNCGRTLWFSCNEAQVAGEPNRAYIDQEGWVNVHFQPENGGEPVQFKLFQANKLRILGEHNKLNALAAAATAALIGVEPTIIAEACLAFQGVEHRLERVLALNGVTFYNDSKATNPEAAISALRAFGEEPIVLIAGGKDKMTPLDDFIAVVQEHVDAVVLLGEAKGRFSQTLKEKNFQNVYLADTLADSIDTAYRLAKGGKPVLFSPACSSFDMFKNFEERGTVFKELVHAYARKQSDSSESPNTPQVSAS